jgi:hypothetical protein
MERILSVVQAASSIDLVKLSVAKAELGVTDTASDYRIVRYISQASAAAAAFCGRVLVEETVSEQIRMFPRVDSASLVNTPDRIKLTRRPVSAISSVVEDGVTLTIGTDFELDPGTGRLSRLSDDEQIAWHFRKLVVGYTAGYAADAIPADLQAAVIDIIQGLWSSFARDPFIKREVVPGAYDVTFQDQSGYGLTDYQCGLLAPYVSVAI